MRIIGLDVGTKTIGVAVSDELGWTAQGLETIARNPNKEDSGFDRLRELTAEYHPEAIVVGLPKNMDGTIGSRGEACNRFAEEVENRFALPVIMWDERLTSVAAEKMLISADVSRKKRKKVIDKTAAVFILQGYLDSKAALK